MSIKNTPVNPHCGWQLFVNSFGVYVNRFEFFIRDKAFGKTEAK